jgi:hypothetical protein
MKTEAVGDASDGPAVSAVVHMCCNIRIRALIAAHRAAAHAAREMGPRLP